MINHLGNQLEKRFFIKDKKHSPLYLEFEHIGTLCFNIGDSFEYFLEENCLGSCPINCPRDLNGKLEVDQGKLEDRIKKKLELLQSFLVGELNKEQCLRIDLMNHVILDTLLQFYSDEFDMEFDESDILLLELGEFVENVIIDFIQYEGQTLLQKPFDTAIEYFEELLQNEVEDSADQKWQAENKSWEQEGIGAEWDKKEDTVEDAIMRFLSDDYYNPQSLNNALGHDIDYLNRYLKEFAKIHHISELEENHLAEFLSVWLAREFVLSDSKHISFVFRATARFITFLYHVYNINLKREFLNYYEKLKLDLPRVIEATNIFIAEYNLLEAILNSQREEIEQRIGFYRVIYIHDRPKHIIEVQNIYDEQDQLMLNLNSSACFKLKKGDILHATLINKSDTWEVLEIQFIYPQPAKKFI
jgi:hypothetical protein